MLQYKIHDSLKWDASVSTGYILSPESWSNIDTVGLSCDNFNGRLSSLDHSSQISQAKKPQCGNDRIANQEVYNLGWSTTCAYDKDIKNTSAQIWHTHVTCQRRIKQEMRLIFWRQLWPVLRRWLGLEPNVEWFKLKLPKFLLMFQLNSVRAFTKFE